VSQLGGLITGFPPALIFAERTSEKGGGEFERETFLQKKKLNDEYKRAMDYDRAAREREIFGSESGYSTSETRSEMSYRANEYVLLYWISISWY
jgi:hypothetical protein